MSVRSVWLWLPLLMACWLGWAAPALADVDVQLQVGATEVAVGETLDVQLDAMSSDDQEPTSPDLVAPNSFQVRGPSIGSRQQVSINGFHMVRQVGISASWQLTPTRAGVYTVGPASVQVGGHRQASQTVQIRVLPEGQGQRAQRRQNRGRRTPGGFTPFDPFNDNDAFDSLFDRLRNGGRTAPDQLPAPPEGLVPAHLPDSTAFLDAHVDTTHAVVGQQVTLSIYAHGSEGLFQEAGGAREPTTPDFLSQRLVEDGSRQPVYQYERDGQRWIAVKVRELALFPIRAGQLVVGPLEFGFLGRRYGIRNGQGLVRQSRPITIDVSEPPAQGRPPGFAGDVGDFSLGAVVEPRKVAVGGSIAVTAYVKGTGRLPGALKLPEQAGVEWLEPTLRDDPAVTASKIGGARTFNYIVRLTRPGLIDLGNLTLSYYSPTNHRYRVVPMALGQVTVDAPPAGAAAAASPTTPAGPKLSELVKFRTRIEGPPTASYWADRRAFYWLLGAGPALLVLAAALRSLLRALRRRLARRGQSAAEHATRALAEGRQALERAEWGNVASAAERALYLSVEWATGLRARALLRAELAGRLVAEGLSEPIATELVELLDRCSELRRGAIGVRTDVSPGEGAGARELLERVQTLVKRLLRRAPARRAAAGREEEARA